MVEDRAMLAVAVEVYELQLAAGRHFLHEHPTTATGWREPVVECLRRDTRVAEVVGAQCRYGLTTGLANTAYRP